MSLNGLGSFLDMQDSTQGNHQATSYGQQDAALHPFHDKDASSFRVCNEQQSDNPFQLLESEKDETLNYLVDFEWSELVEDGVDKPSDVNKGTKNIVWQRTKWTDEMVKDLITAASYIGNDASSLISKSERRKLFLCPKKGKWRAISDAMVERGYYVSPQQCEDKFNDLNKKYKRLNTIIGRGITCDVVENPALLESMDLSDEAKEEVMKILNYKHLSYPEMCSYHNGNRLFLPHDEALHWSLLRALKGKVNYESESLIEAVSAKRKRQEEPDNVSLGSPSNHIACNTCSNPHKPGDDTNLIDINFDGGDGEKLQSEGLMSSFLKMQEQKVQLQAQMLELEKERFEWLKYSKKKNMELQRMRLENEYMKLENERMAFELKRRELGTNVN